MKIENLQSALQGFCAGAIVMAYVADYNRSQLPTAIAFLFFSIFGSVLIRVGDKNKR